MATKIDARSAPPFDQGLFLLHYNKGREMLQEQDLEGARKELESALRLRPEDEDVLNLLGLVYFKGNEHAEAERIYRRLAVRNPDVFILHSNLGLVLFKQGKLDEAEVALRRAVDLKPNYTKSHLYLGLLYQKKKKLGLALEHLRFAGAQKTAREVEEALRTAAMPTAPGDTLPPGALRVDQVRAAANLPPERSPDAAPSARSETAAFDKPPIEKTPGGEAETAKVKTRPVAQAAATSASDSEAEGGLGHAPLLSSIEGPLDAGGRRDSTPRTLPLETRGTAAVHGASRTFSLKDNGYLEISSAGRVFVKRGTVSTYTGLLRFVNEKNLSGTSAETMVRVEGNGKLFLFEKGRRTFLIDLDNEFIYVEGANLLAMEESLAFRKEPIYDYSRHRKVEAIKIYGRGSLAISTAMEPLTLRVTGDFPLNLSSESLVAWTGDLIPTVLDDTELDGVMTSPEAGFRIRFEGEGVVIAEEA